MKERSTGIIKSAFHLKSGCMAQTVGPFSFAATSGIPWSGCLGFFPVRTIWKGMGLRKWAETFWRSLILVHTFTGALEYVIHQLRLNNFHTSCMKIKGLVDEKLNITLQCALGAQKVISVLGFERNVASRAREVILPFYSALLEWCIHPESPQHNDMELLEQVKKATKMIRWLERP